MSNKTVNLILFLSLLLVHFYHSSSTPTSLENETGADLDLDHPDPNPAVTMNPYTNLSIEDLLELEMEDNPIRDPLSIAIPMTLIYSLILISGLIGNISTCIVIARTGYMHTATNFYLFSLAMSDLLLLICGVPQEIYHIWIKYPYIFGEAFCVIRGLAAETSANATVLTITAFTVERFVAIVYPLKSHKLSQLSRVVRMIVIIWVVALCLALPQAAQFGVLDQMSRLNPSTILIKGAWCTIAREIFPYAFQISIFVFFIIPMTIITVLYILIGLKLRNSRKSLSDGNNEPRIQPRHSQSHVVRMLVAVVVAFFLCWAPFHAQRLMALYGSSQKQHSTFFLKVYEALTHVSGVLYFVSTCINPILYHIMSNKFRQAFKDTLSRICGSTPPSRYHHSRTYSSMYHNHNRSVRRPLGKADSIPLERFGAKGCTCVKMAESVLSDKEGIVTKTHCPLCGGKKGEAFTFLKRQDNHLLTIEGEGNGNPRLLSPLTTSHEGDGDGDSGLQMKVINSNGNGMSVGLGAPNRSSLRRNGNKGKKKQGPKTLKAFLSLNSKKGSGGVGGNKCPCQFHGGSGTGTGTLPFDKRKLSGGGLRKNASHCSIDSNHTNTISNSSLQDLDEGEYTSEELAGYMAEINMNIVLDSPPSCSSQNKDREMDLDLDLDLNGPSET